jgi:hypothetical protein
METNSSSAAHPSDAATPAPGGGSKSTPQPATRQSTTDRADASQPAISKPVERLFPFVLRSRALIVGRESLRRSRSKLHFVLITRDISDASRAEILADFAPYPIVQHFAAEDLERFFNIRGAKVVGFSKSGLAQSIYAELKAHRINPPVVKPGPVTTQVSPAAGPFSAPRPLPQKRDPRVRPPAGHGEPRRPPARWSGKARPQQFKTREAFKLHR